MNRDRIAARSKGNSGLSLLIVPAAVLVLQTACGSSQTPRPPDLQQQVRRLNDAVDRMQTQIEESQRELAELRNQLAVLRDSTSAPAFGHPEQESVPSAADLAAAVASIRETQAIHDSQLATLNQTKVESDSKYPVKLSGLLLMTGMVNTQRVDIAQTPSAALHGAGSTAATLSQTVLGLDARGPHLIGAESRADARFDFYGAGGAAYTAGSTLGLLRLRTAHAELDWQHSSAFFCLDRPLLNPDGPASLLAVAVPALAWSGNLWTWNPQLGASHDFFADRKLMVRAQAALIFVADPPPVDVTGAAGVSSPPSTTESSRWPGFQARLAVVNTGKEDGAHFGISGFVAPHQLSAPQRFDSWAGALDFRFPFLRSAVLSGNAYRGQALGGLGAGAFKDYVTGTYDGEQYLHVLDDIGGWLQWEQRAGERLEFNEAVGVDAVPAHQIRPFTVNNYANDYNLARNRTLTGNVIYKPSAYLLFSLEYRRIASSYVNSPTEISDIIGLAAGYRF